MEMAGELSIPKREQIEDMQIEDAAEQETGTEKAKEGQVLGILCMQTYDKIIGMDLDKWRQGCGEVENVDWASLSSTPLDFSFHLLHRDFPLPLGMNPFVLGSNTHMAGGFHPRRRRHGWHVGFYNCLVGPPNDNIYKVEFDEESDELSIFDGTETNSLPPPPAPLAGSLAVNMLGDIYFFRHRNLIEGEMDGLLVLDSKDKQWKWLPPPPPVSEKDSVGCFPYWDCFVLHNKLFLRCSSQCGFDDDLPIYSFDPQTRKWTREHYEEQGIYHPLHSFRLGVDDLLQSDLPKITVSVPNFSNDINSSVMLAFACHDKERTQDPRIYALLVNKNGVVRYQSLEESFKGVLPSFSNVLGCMLVDLGSSTVCALIYGAAYECPKSVLCISVFTLAKALQPDTHTDADTDAPPAKEQRFLSVCVLGKQVYTLDEENEPIQEAFACHSKKNIKMSKKRKKSLY